MEGYGLVLWDVGGKAQFGSTGDVPRSIPDPDPPVPRTTHNESDANSWMGWLGENFQESQPWRGVGCRIGGSLERSSSMGSFQWCLRSTRSGWDSHQCHSLQPACIHPHCPIPIRGPGIPAGSPMPEPTTAAALCPLELGTMGRGSPGWATEELRLQRCHRQAKGNFILKMKEKQYKSHNPAQLLGFRVGLVLFSPLS